MRYDRASQLAGRWAEEGRRVQTIDDQERFERARDEARRCGLGLEPTAEGLALEADGMRLVPDFRDMLPRLARGRLGRELLVRAAKVKGVENPLVVDATAGLGQDALLLAAAGFRVKLFERNEVIAALLADALRRASADAGLADVVARMELSGSDSVEGLRTLAEHADVVYLDPMFPERRKSAAVKKKFQLLHHLERPCDDAEELLHAAMEARPRKVVVKRPAKGPFLAGVEPSYSIKGKAVRYDVIALASLGRQLP